MIISNYFSYYLSGRDGEGWMHTDVAIGEASWPLIDRVEHGIDQCESIDVKF